MDLDYNLTKDSKHLHLRADEHEQQVPAESPEVFQDGKAYKLINLNYDIVIVVDDSTSMQLGAPISRWEECRDAIGRIAEAALQFDTGGIEVYFINSPNNGTCRSSKEVHTLFESVRLAPGTPTGAKLEQLLHAYWEKLKHSTRLFGGPVNPPKPVIFIVLTDGEPTDNPKEVILKYAKNLHRAKWQKHQVGIQFVQVGDSKGAAKSLKAMDDDLKQQCKRDIVDYTLYDATAASGSSEEDHTIQGKILKILVGAVDEDVDRKAAGSVQAKKENALPPAYQRATTSRR